MKKRYWIIPGVILLVILIALIALPFLIDVNSFRPRLESEASLALGRKVKLGNLSLSILTGSIGADDIEVADDPAFSQQNFLTAKSVRIAVAMHPLIFERKVEVEGIEIQNPQISLLKSEDGAWNFSSLGPAAHQGPQTPASNLPATLPSISVARFSEENGVITVTDLGSNLPSRVYDHVQLVVTDFSSAKPFRIDLSASLPGGGDANISGLVGPISSTNAARSPIDVAVKLNNLHIAAYRFVDPRSGIDGIANLDETLHSDGTNATLAGTFFGSHMKLAPHGKPTATEISVRHAIDWNLEQRSGTLTQADIAVGKAHLHASGTVQNRSATPHIDVQLTGTDMPIDDLQSMVPALDIKTPYGSTMRGGAASIKLHIFGTPAGLTVAGHVSSVDTTQVGFNLGAQLGSVAAFAGKTISSPDTAVKSISFDTVVTRAGVKVENIEMDIPSVSTGTGSGTVTPDNQLHFDLLTYPTNGMAGGMQKLSAAGNNKVTVPMTITGPVEKPVFTADTKAATKSMVSGATKGVGAAIGSIFKKKPKDNTDPSTQPASAAPQK
jgi:AsmA protein